MKWKSPISKCMGGRSGFSAIGEIQNGATVRVCFIPVRMFIIKDSLTDGWVRGRERGVWWRKYKLMLPLCKAVWEFYT